MGIIRADARRRVVKRIAIRAFLLTTNHYCMMHCGPRFVLCAYLFVAPSRGGFSGFFVNAARYVSSPRAGQGAGMLCLPVSNLGAVLPCERTIDNDASTRAGVDLDTVDERLQFCGRACGRYSVKFKVGALVTMAGLSCDVGSRRTLSHSVTAHRWYQAQFGRQGVSNCHKSSDPSAVPIAARAVGVSLATC